MTDQKVVTQEEWLAARQELLAREKEHTRLGDELAQERRQLPWVRLDKEYVLQTSDGPKTLLELFEGRSQLVIYHFMFGPDYEAGCPVCSSIADSFSGVLAHLDARDVTMICLSGAPLDKLLAYRERMGWSFNWVSSYASDFNFDFGHSRTTEDTRSWLGDPAPDIPSQFASECGTDVVSYMSEGPGLTVLARSDGEVYLTYATTARGLEPVMVYYHILDLVPKGRNEGDPADPTWIRRHDEFSAQ
jgi:predicted dithiol-disulfide oxidoreductase (DUF899 family)